MLDDLPAGSEELRGEAVGAGRLAGRHVFDGLPNLVLAEWRVKVFQV